MIWRAIYMEHKKHYVVVDENGHGIAVFNTEKEAAIFQYKEKIYLKTRIIPIWNWNYKGRL